MTAALGASLAKLPYLGSMVAPLLLTVILLLSYKLKFYSSLGRGFGGLRGLGSLFGDFGLIELLGNFLVVEKVKIGLFFFEMHLVLGGDYF